MRNQYSENLAKAMIQNMTIGGLDIHENEKKEDEKKDAKSKIEDVASKATVEKENDNNI